MQNWLLAAAVVLAGQNVPPFAGTWTAAHDGQTFARLELRDVNGDGRPRRADVRAARTP
jgi:hypothetical protein